MDGKANFKEYANSKGFAIHVRDDKMNAYLILRKGALVKEEDVMNYLHELGICNGIQKNIVRGMCRQRIYDYPYLIAFGTPQIDGDGPRVIERYPREHHIDYDIEDNNLNFRDLKYARNIQKNMIICDINVDYRGKEGLDIYNQVVKARMGAVDNSPIKLGANTEITPDGKHIVASINGNLVWNKQEGVFEVQDTITVEGDVDKTIGDINFIGNLVIKGNVHDGFKLKTGGNLTVEGYVEYSNIECDGDVEIKLGMIGNNNGTIDCKGNVKADFFENVVYVKSGKNIITNMSIASNLYAMDSIKIENDGLLIGGESIARNYIDCKETGTETHTPTSLIAGFYYPDYFQIIEKEAELEEKKSSYEKHQLDIEFLEERKQSYKLTQEEKDTLKADYVALDEINEEINALRDVILQLKDKYNPKCMVTITGTIYPLTKVMLVDKKYLYEHLESNHKLHLKDLKLKIIGEFNQLPEEEEPEVDEEGNVIEKEEVIIEEKDPLEERKKLLGR